MKNNKLLLVASSTPVGLASLAEESSHSCTLLQRVRALSGKRMGCADDILASCPRSTGRFTRSTTSIPVRARLIMEASS